MILRKPLAQRRFALQNHHGSVPVVSTYSISRRQLKSNAAEDSGSYSGAFAKKSESRSLNEHPKLLINFTGTVFRHNEMTNSSMLTYGVITILDSFRYLAIKGCGFYNNSYENAQVRGSL